MAALAVLWAPVRTLSRVAEERRVLLAFGITALVAALSLVSTVLSLYGGLFESSFQDLPPDFPPELVRGIETGLSIGVPIIVVLSPFVNWLVISLLMQLVTRFFGGAGPFSGMLAVVGVAQMPNVISALIGLPLTALQVALGPDNPATVVASLLGTVIGLAVLAWTIALIVIGAAFARRVGYGESAGSCAISCGGCLALIILATVAAVLVAVLVGAASSAGAS